MTYVELEAIRGRVRDHRWLPESKEWTCDRDIPVLLAWIDDLCEEIEQLRDELNDMEKEG